MEKMTLTPTHILEYLYCPRFTYFEYVLQVPQHQEKLFKVQKGRDVHEQKTVINKSYLRKKIGVIDKLQNQYLTNAFLRGEVDEALFLEDGTMAPLDYKFAKYEGRVYDTYKTQMICYACLIEDNFGKKVNSAYLVYTRSKNKIIRIDISETDKEKVQKAATEIYEIIKQNFYPKATKFKKRCVNCTYRNICTQ